MDQILKDMMPLTLLYRDQIPAVKFGVNLIAGHFIGQIPIHAKRAEQDKWVAVLEGWLTRCAGMDDHDMQNIRELIAKKLG